MTRILRLGEFPEIGVATGTPVIRVLAPTVYPCRIHSTVGDEAVGILHIRHSSRLEADPDDLA